MIPGGTEAGMRAVARVRGVREKDSRLGLQQALAEAQSLQGRADAVRRQLAAGGAFEAGPGAEFAERRRVLESLGDELRSAEAAAESARNVAVAARAAWQQDKTRLSAVEMLLERRAETRRAERARREAHELDDIAGQLHQRHAVVARAARAEVAPARPGGIEEAS
ncbi:flagellar export protein FliJ [Nocardioides daedukensis]|uniref:Flagellar FliJ protein n=1 Tax=Nocardioides daedukensis TaxID=634462 RepID=A0A7Y9RYR8_9ACTN|nr:flagellar FliJ family protein [Nocardioides daedukensis]NYG58720.1 flagellar export protein FliJ [Nocardioides daedukensis]